MPNVFNAKRYNARMNEIFENAKRLKKLRIPSKIEDEILEVANLYNEVTTSDLQGIASVTSKKIFNMIKEELNRCGVTKPGNQLHLVECLKESGLIDEVK